mgnify:CR=1 FL=1
MSNMQRWMRENGITTYMLAQEMGISQTSVALKSNCKTHWQYSDMSFLRNRYGLSSDFVQDFVPYDIYMESMKSHGIPICV